MFVFCYMKHASIILKQNFFPQEILLTNNKYILMNRV